jgi:hypothetical protein
VEEVVTGSLQTRGVGLYGCLRNLTDKVSIRLSGGRAGKYEYIAYVSSFIRRHWAVIG